MPGDLCRRTQARSTSARSAGLTQHMRIKPPGPSTSTTGASSGSNAVPITSVGRGLLNNASRCYDRSRITVPDRTIEGGLCPPRERETYRSSVFRPICPVSVLHEPGVSRPKSVRKRVFVGNTGIDARMRTRAHRFWHGYCSSETGSVDMLDRILVREIISVLMGSTCYLGLTVPERLDMVKHLLDLMSPKGGSRFKVPGSRFEVPGNGSPTSGKR